MPKTRTYNKKAGANAAWHTASRQYGRGRGAKCSQRFKAKSARIQIN